jgi:AhpD family alkylhydroperoxidase
MNKYEAIDYPTVIPEVFGSLLTVHKVLAEQGLDRKLGHLIFLRASQINACAYCVNMHVREALEDGESHDRLHQVIVWEQCDDFTDREKAALAWTEALTDLSTQADMGALRRHLRDHFTDQQIGVLTTAVGMINLWNRINVSRH